MLRHGAPAGAGRPGVINLQVDVIGAADQGRGIVNRSLQRGRLATEHHPAVERSDQLAEHRQAVDPFQQQRVCSRAGVGNACLHQGLDVAQIVADRCRQLRNDRAMSGIFCQEGLGRRIRSHRCLFRRGCDVVRGSEALARRI